MINATVEGHTLRCGGCRSHLAYIGLRNEREPEWEDEAEYILEFRDPIYRLEGHEGTVYGLPGRLRKGRQQPFRRTVVSSDPNERRTFEHLPLLQTLSVYCPACGRKNHVASSLPDAASWPASERREVLGTLLEELFRRFEGVFGVTLRDMYRLLDEACGAFNFDRVDLTTVDWSAPPPKPRYDMAKPDDHPAILERVDHLIARDRRRLAAQGRRFAVHDKLPAPKSPQPQSDGDPAL